MTPTQQKIAENLKQHHHRSWVKVANLAHSIGKTPRQLEGPLERMSAAGYVETAVRVDECVRLTPKGRRYQNGG